VNFFSAQDKVQDKPSQGCPTKTFGVLKTPKVCYLLPQAGPSKE